MQDNTITISDAFLNFYNNLINQLPGIGIGILIVALGFLIAKWIGQFARKRIDARTHDPLMSKFLGQAIRYILVIFVIMIALRAAGMGGVATVILTAAGASAIVFGFAFKDIGKYFIAGIILAFNRPFDVNVSVEI